MKANNTYDMKAMFDRFNDIDNDIDNEVKTMLDQISYTN